MASIAEQEIKLPVPATSSTPKNHFVNLSRKVVIHRMETSECLDSRLFWAIVLWSRCGPAVSDMVVKKDERGWIVKEHGAAVPAKLTDLAGVLGLDPQKMKAPLSRAAARLAELGAIRFGEQIPGASRARVMYFVQEPRLPEKPVKLPVPATWHVGKFTITSDQLPEDQVARTRAIEFLNDASTRWKSDLKDLRTSYKKLLEHAAAEGLILISFNSSISREDPPPQPSIKVPPDSPTEPREEEEESPPINPEPTPAPKKDESPPEPAPADTFAQFKAAYPKHRLDEAKAKALFKALPPAAQKRALSGLLNVYLTCQRWQDAGGKWIPFASTFLRDKAYDADPPPRMEKIHGGKQLQSADEVLAYMRSQSEES